jgi:hypothetical protein
VTETARPEWIACIIQEDSASVALCGRDVFNEFWFVDVEHARLTVEQGGRLVPCEQCLDGVVDWTAYIQAAIDDAVTTITLSRAATGGSGTETLNLYGATVYALDRTQVP